MISVLLIGTHLISPSPEHTLWICAGKELQEVRYVLSHEGDDVSPETVVPRGTISGHINTEAMELAVAISFAFAVLHDLAFDFAADVLLIECVSHICFQSCSARAAYTNDIFNERIDLALRPALRH